LDLSSFYKMTSPGGRSPDRLLWGGKAYAAVAHPLAPVFNNVQPSGMYVPVISIGASSWSITACILCSPTLEKKARELVFQLPGYMD
jgi:hypothetical protein